MYWPEVHDLAGFYETELGKSVQSRLCSCIRNMLTPPLDGVTVGIGFAQPYLKSFMDEEGNLTIAAMPATQGALCWPVGNKNLSLLTREADLPLGDETVDRVIIAHALEFTERPLHLLNEVWRVLKPEGKVFVIAPNRLSIWARAEKTPFGHGHPFTPHQLEELAEEANFLRLGMEQALFMPPVESPALLKTAEMFGALRKFFPVPFGGVLVMKAEKKVYAPAKLTRKIRKANPLYEPAKAGG